MFHLNLDPTKIYNTNEPNNVKWDKLSLNNSADSLLSLLLSLKVKPIIRYEKSSEMAKELGGQLDVYHLLMILQIKIQQEANLFNNNIFKDNSPLLLILDRKTDPITPLLFAWNYEAMIHELININNGRVNCRTHFQNTQKVYPLYNIQEKEIILNTNHDKFYKKNQYANFGDLGPNIKEYVASYNEKTQQNMKLESIKDMKKFIEQYPEFKKLSLNVSNHVNLVELISELVDKNNCFIVSKLEQNLACSYHHNNDFKVFDIVNY